MQIVLVQVGEDLRGGEIWRHTRRRSPDRRSEPFPFPSPPMTIATAGAEVLISFFREHNFDFSVTSEVMPGVERSFTSFEAAAQEATQSRLFAGVHFPFDLSTGQRLGADVADFLVDNLLTSRDRDD